MSITSPLFLLLALLSALIFRRLPAKGRNLWLLAVSAGFVATWSWEFVLVLLVFCLVNYGLGLNIEHAARKKPRVIFGIFFNLLTLFLFKYNQFYLPGLIRLLEKAGMHGSWDGLKILVPIGLSFLVVQTISYLVDISNQRIQAERNLLKFGLYIVYFPKLLSGPVERAKQFLPRLDQPLVFDRILLERSLSLIMVGLFRKLVFANSLFRMIPENAFLTPQEYAGQHLVFWLFAYSFALFNDFAGYTSIIRGVSLWFGIELTNNFNLPYFSRSITEFWNRWHISLSNWLRDYIFFPLSRSLMRRYPERNHLINLVVPPLVTMLASGLWHGLSWSLLVWGGLHGLFLVLERVAGLIRPSVPIQEQSRRKQGLGIALTFSLTALAWLPFRMSLPVAWTYFKGMFNWSMPDFKLLAHYILGDATWLSWTPLNLPNPVLILVLALALGFDILMNQKGTEKELRAFSPKVQVLLFVIILLLIFLSLFADSTAPFVYQGF